MTNAYRQTERTYRWNVTWRVLTAIFGGFALANTSGILLTYLLPFSKVDALTTSLLLSFAIYAGAVMWVFSHRSMLKALGGVWVPAVFFLAIILLFKLVGVSR
uniref:DUF3649 domain-containing protein n=1 Tax=Cellvibrio fontiphilus TaxID=1815559 RepID=UPI002B4BC607|nr:DUF3649 domain-containing protein [Cellvibrio fontiphilus]